MRQYEHVIEIMRNNGGYATLGFLNEHVNTSAWLTKTPFATIRRIVQDERFFFKIKPGLWALEEMRTEVYRKLKISGAANDASHDVFNHTYYQGLLVELGNLKGYKTYIPPQDKNKKFLEKPLSAISSIDTIFEFSYEKMVSRAKTIDVIWFNDRNMPYSFFEVEHTTDMQNSLLKFFDLQDFHSNFYIVSAAERRREFEQKLNYQAFNAINERVEFIDYDLVSKLHSKSFELSALRDL